MAEVRVSSEVVAGGGESIRALAAELDARLQSAEASVAGVLSASWHGQAADAFGSGWAEWSAGAIKVAESLRGIAALLGDAAVAYAETEGEVEGTWRSSEVASQPSPFRGE